MLSMAPCRLLGVYMPSEIVVYLMSVDSPIVLVTTLIKLLPAEADRVSLVWESAPNLRIQYQREIAPTQLEFVGPRYDADYYVEVAETGSVERGFGVDLSLTPVSDLASPLHASSVLPPLCLALGTHGWSPPEDGDNRVVWASSPLGHLSVGVVPTDREHWNVELSAATTECSGDTAEVAALLASTVVWETGTVSVGEDELMGPLEFHTFLEGRLLRCGRSWDGSGNCLFAVLERGRLAFTGDGWPSKWTIGPDVRAQRRSRRRNTILAAVTALTVVALVLGLGVWVGLILAGSLAALAVLSRWLTV